MAGVYTAEPSWCEIIYTYTISDPLGDTALTFDALTQTFTFDKIDDLAPSGSAFIDYTVTMRGTSGNVIPVFDEQSFTLKLKNPCIDPAYVSI